MLGIPSIVSRHPRGTRADWQWRLAWKTTLLLGHVLRVAAALPSLSLPVLFFSLLAINYGLVAVLLCGGTVVAFCGTWSAVHKRTFQTYVALPVQQQVLSWWRYARTWHTVCAVHGLTKRAGDREFRPTLQGVRIGKHVDELDLRTALGQSIEDWQRQTRGLAATWQADRLTVRSVSPGQLRVTITRRDDLATVVPLTRRSSSASEDLSSLEIGISDSRDGRWQLPLLGHHVLVAGATGAGKGSVLWSLIAGLAPEVKTGRVRLCVIDPKGGMELGAGAPMFTAFSHDAIEGTMDVLRILVGIMHDRANHLRGQSRLHSPTPAEPLFVLIIDEVAALTSYVTDRKVRSEIERLLSLLLSQGRAVGISVVAAIQDPSKDTLPVRQLFTVRIGLRLTEATQTTMVLGQGAREAGADCESISDKTPGVGYVMTDGTSEPQRVRAFHVTDSDIADLANKFIPPVWRGGDIHDGGGATNEQMETS